MAYRPPPPDRQCTAQSKQAGRRCAKWAVPGLKVCRMHGGAAPQARAAAARNVAQAAALAAVATYGLPAEVDPLDALLGELHRTAGHVAWLNAEVARLQSVITTGAFGVQVIDATVQLYQSERRHLSKVAADCLRAGVEERRVQLAERQGELVAEVIRAVLSDLGVDPSSEEARTVVRRHLMAVPA